MNCGTSGCDHNDAMRCAGGRSLWSAKVERDCNTCRHHVQGSSIDYAKPRCWDCVSTAGIVKQTLPHWEPHKEDKQMSGGIEEMHREERRVQVGTPPGLRAKVTSDGSTASYYELPKGAKELQDLIAHRNMNAQIGEVFRECYRYGQASHCDELRGIKKIIFYASAELKRLEALQ